jgi:TRAP transporter TAXI family solute receptor
MDPSKDAAPEPGRLAHVRELLWIAVPAILLIAAAFWATLQFVKPAPPSRITVAAATKGSPYHALAERYREFLAENGVTLDIHESSGSFENLKLLRSGEVQAGFVQGGIAAGTDTSELASLGRVLYEPVWIFHDASVPLERLTDLRGKRILVGPAGGGTDHLARRLLAANGVTPETATFINMELPDYVDALASGRADVRLLVLGASAVTVQRLFANPKLKLLSLTQADAYTQRFPYLTRLDLRRGVVDFARDIPPADVAMVATTAAFVVRDDLHSALTNLLTQALIVVHSQPSLDRKGEARVFERTGEFPLRTDPEFTLSDEARRVYRSGPPLLQRYMPFWMATLADRLVLMLIPIVGILLPVLRFAPPVYTWRVLRRFLYWYRELQQIEAGFDPKAGPEHLARIRAKIDAIEDAANRIEVPLGFANQLYDLRQHIELVRRRLVEEAADA